MCDFLFVFAFSKEPVRMMYKIFCFYHKMNNFHKYISFSQSIIVCVCFFRSDCIPPALNTWFYFCVSTRNSILCKCTNWNRAALRFNPINVKMLREIHPKTIIFKREKEYSVESTSVDIGTLFRCGSLSILKLMNCNSI